LQVERSEGERKPIFFLKPQKKRGPPEKVQAPHLLDGRHPENRRQSVL
jgi:hypothetical protein